MVIDGSGSAPALLGLERFRVLADMVDGGEVWVLVETDIDRAGCPECGVIATGHGRREVQVRDLPAGGRPVRLVWRKRIWQCCDPDCGTGTWTEASVEIAARAVLTERARRWCVTEVGPGGRSVAAVARELGVGWHTVMTAVETYGRPLVDNPDRIGPVDALGLDEHRMLAARRTGPTVFVTGFVDLRTGQLLDLVVGRSATVVERWLEGRPAWWLNHVQAVALDPHRGYANGLIAGLPHAVRVVDHFHAIKLANAAVDDVRRRVQQATTGHRGRKDDPLYRTRRLATRAWEHLTDRQRDRLLEALAAGDRDGEVGSAILGKELLREVYAAADRRTAGRALTAFYWHCAHADVPELRRLATTISAWQDEVLAYHNEHLSNGPTEAANLLIEKLRRVGHGYRNFGNYRLRLLLALGVQWQTQPTARIRRRHPRSVA